MDSSQYKLVEHQLAVIRKDLGSSMNQMAQALMGMVESHRAFQVYVQEQLDLLRKQAGLAPALVAVPGGLDRDGKEI